MVVFRILGACVAGAAAAAALLAQGGRFSTALDVLTHLAPIYLVMAVVAGAAEAVAFRRPVVMAAAGVGLVAALALMVPELQRAVPTANVEQGVRTLTLVQFNARRINHRYDDIVDWIVAQHPDVAMIEEITPALRDRLLARTGWYVVGRLTTVMIFSPHPVTGIGVRPIVSTRGAPTWVNARMDGPWGPMPLLAVHADWPSRDLEDRQGPILAAVVRAIRTDELLFAGDFNSTPWAFTRQRDDRAFGLHRLTKARFTWPSGLGPLSPFPIDHVYAGDGWRLVSMTRGPRLGSDHFPLVVRLVPAGRLAARSAATGQ